MTKAEKEAREQSSWAIQNRIMDMSRAQTVPFRQRGVSKEEVIKEMEKIAESLEKTK